MKKTRLDIINHYACLGYREINDHLRGSNNDPDTLKLILELDEALEKLDSYDNSIVYRLENILPNWEYTQIWFSKNIGRIITRPDFLSTSKQRRKDNSVDLIIATIGNSNAKDITEIISRNSLTKARNENEVLIKRNTNFEIQRIDSENEIIYLRETKSLAELVFTADLIFKDPEVTKKLESKPLTNYSLTDLGLI